MIPLRNANFRTPSASAGSNGVDGRGYTMRLALRAAMLNVREEQDD